MLNGSEEILNKIADWDLKEDLTDNTNGLTEAKIYRQIQDYFKNYKQYSEDISRISGQLDIVLQDFIGESKQVEQVADFLNKGAEKETREINQTLKLIEDFTYKIDEINGKSKDIISLAYDMDKTNQNVSKSMDLLVLNQKKNDEAIQDIFGVVKNLISKTLKIGEITKLINQISSETNLLGLNAKVEAVHAGAAGRGFSVVANEIQRLSEESKKASENISEMIKSVIDEISLLEKAAQNSQGTFKYQRDSVNEVTHAIEKNSEFISTYISEQESFNSSIEGIKADENVLVNSVSNVFASIREVTATANEISSLTYNQNNSISLLEKLAADLAGGIASIKRESNKVKVQALSAKKRKIAIIFDIEHTFFDPIKKDAVKAGGIYNYDIDFYAPKSRGAEGTKEMACFLDKIIDEKVDGLIICPIEDEEIHQRLRRVNSAGIKIVFLNSKIEGIDYVSFIQTNSIAAGEAAAQVLKGIIGTQGEVIINTWSDANNSAFDERINGFEKKIRENTKIDVHIVPVKTTHTANEAETVFRSMLKTYPDARCVFMTGCELALLFADYMRKYKPDIEAITIDFTKEVQEAMSQSLIQYALGQRHSTWGSMAIDFIDKSVNKKPVQKYVDTGTFEVNQQNLNIYKSFIV